MIENEIINARYGDSPPLLRSRPRRRGFLEWNLELASSIELNYGNCARLLIKRARLYYRIIKNQLNGILAVESVTAHVEDVALDCLVRDICPSPAPTPSP